MLLLVLFEIIFSTQENDIDIDMTLNTSEIDRAYLTVKQCEEKQYIGLNYEEAVNLVNSFNTEDDFKKILEKTLESHLFEVLYDKHKILDKYKFRIFLRNKWDDLTIFARMTNLIDIYTGEIFNEIMFGRLPFDICNFVYKSKDLDPSKCATSNIAHIIISKYIVRLTVLCLSENYLFNKYKEDVRDLYNPINECNDLGLENFYLGLLEKKRINGTFIRQNSYFHQKFDSKIENLEEYKFIYELLEFEFDYILNYVVQTLKQHGNRHNPAFWTNLLKLNLVKFDNLLMNQLIRFKIFNLQKNEGEFFLLFDPKNYTKKRISFLGEEFNFIDGGYEFITDSQSEDVLTLEGCKEINLKNLTVMVDKVYRFANCLPFDLVMTFLQLYSENFKVFIMVNIFKTDKFIYVKIKHIGDPPYNSILNRHRDRNDITQEVREELREKHERGLTPKFTPIFEYTKEYFFRRPDNFVGNATMSRCLKLSCGHYIGEECLEEWFTYGLGKCQYCRKDVFILGYFEHETYLVE
ncbi:hypothetical protein NGRA_0852 [Nosema granulosis]|uniref:RING-type domain-containing protein n=1 Tax=Nosema granulosis TaxID=83296 RepID=A0A9P6KZ70_9MICR|nr:hypothetical protein NGRA_0852 [Nosema granulosis]